MGLFFTSLTPLTYFLGLGGDALDLELLSCYCPQ